MASPSWDSISQYLSIGCPIEITSNEDGFRGSWYRGTIIAPPRKRATKVLVEYSTLRDGGRPLREAVEPGLIRPALPRKKRHAFSENDKVDAYTRDGWWEGVIVEVKEDDKYTVFFRWTREEEVFTASMLRLHRHWRNGEWTPPPDEGTFV